MKKIVVSTIAIIIALYANNAYAQDGTWQQVDPRSEIDGYPESEECNLVPEPPALEEECCTYAVTLTLEVPYYEITGTIGAFCPVVDCVALRDDFSCGVLDVSCHLRAWFSWTVCNFKTRIVEPLVCFFEAWFKAFASLLSLLWQPWFDILAFVKWLGQFARWLLDNICIAPFAAIIAFISSFLHQTETCRVELIPTPGDGTPTWTPTPTPISTVAVPTPDITAPAWTPFPTAPWAGASPTPIACDVAIDVSQYGVPTSCSSPSGIGEILWCGFVGGIKAAQDFALTSLGTVWMPRIALWLSTVFYVFWRVQGLWGGGSDTGGE